MTADAESPGSAVTRRRRALGLGLAVVVVFGLVLPRVVRMTAARVQIEDDNYLYSAYLIHRGQSPYLDFVQANPPLLEQATAPLFTAFGPHYRVGEAFSAFAVLVTALALWRIGALLFAPLAGAIAAVLYSWMPLVFRYHFFEREIFSLAASSVGLCVALGWRRKASPAPLLTSRWPALGIAGALLGVAFHCKQVGVFPALAIVIEGLIAGQRRQALLLGLAFAASAGGLLVADLAVYGPDVLLQSFALHLIKGAPAPAGIRIERLLIELAPMLPLALVGVWVLRGRGSVRLPILWAALELSFMLVVSSTFWPHYMIPLLGPVLLIAGGAWAAGPGARKLAVLATVAGCLVLVWQARDHPRERLGFGGVSRAALEQTAAVVASIVPPQSDALLCPPVVALEADRVKLYNYIDTLGFTRQVQAAYRDGRLGELLRRGAPESFSRTLARANSTWLPEALEAVRSGRVLAVVPEGELPIPAAFLVQMGYRLAERNPEFEVYASPSTAASR